MFVICLKVFSVVSVIFGGVYSVPVGGDYTENPPPWPLMTEVHYWPLGKVPYYFNLSSYDYIVARRARMSMNEIEAASCVIFEPLIVSPKPHQDFIWLHFTNPTHERDCVHEPRFKDYGEVEIVFGYDCLKPQDIMHTLMHTLGFRDEIGHPKRDQYIRVMWDNIHPEYRHLFRIHPAHDKSHPELEYDPTSIMHFHDRAFSRNGQATIVPVLPGLQIGSTRILSQLDRMRLNVMYGHECNKRQVGKLLDSCKNVMKKGNNTQMSETTYDPGFSFEDISDNNGHNGHQDEDKDNTTEKYMGKNYYDAGYYDDIYGFRDVGNYDRKTHEGNKNHDVEGDEDVMYAVSDEDIANNDKYPKIKSTLNSKLNDHKQHEGRDVTYAGNDGFVANNDKYPKVKPTLILKLKNYKQHEGKDVTYAGNYGFVANNDKYPKIKPTLKHK